MSQDETPMKKSNVRRAKVVGHKIYLRPLEKSDINSDYLEWVNDRSINSFILASGFPVTYESAIEYYEKSQPPHAVYMAVCDIETGTHIGNVRLSSIDFVHRVALYGRLIGHPDFRGKGYGTDTLIQLLRFGFHFIGLNRIWSAAVVDNKVSLGSNDKVGMTREGTLRDFVYVNGEFKDAISLSMLRRDFDEIHGDPEFWAKHDRKVHTS